jgi:hypothetical protein
MIIFIFSKFFIFFYFFPQFFVNLCLFFDFCACAGHFSPDKNAISISDYQFNKNNLPAAPIAHKIPPPAEYF